MAFMCRDCAHPTLKPDFDWAHLSKGPCENCKYVDLCIDRPFQIDPKWKENVTKTLEAAGIPVPPGVRALPPPPPTDRPPRAPKPPRDREVSSFDSTGEEYICGYIYTHASGYREVCILDPRKHRGIIHGAGGAWAKAPRRLR